MLLLQQTVMDPPAVANTPSSSMSSFWCRHDDELVAD
jgi:hypothetical protein